MSINFKTKIWSYLLGVIHGDGHVSERSVSISVGYKEKEYADLLVQLFMQVGLNPKVYRSRNCFKIECHNKKFSDIMKGFKSAGIWTVPQSINKNQYLSGVFDTDGCVAEPTKCKVLKIGLKRSGNLNIIKKMLTDLGVRDINVKDRVSTFNGKPYEVEEISISGMDRIIKMASILNLRSPKKAKRLKEMIESINHLQSIKPLWEQVAIFIKKPKTWKQIATHFSLTKDGVDSVMQNLKKHYTVNKIIPKQPLIKYSIVK